MPSTRTRNEARQSSTEERPEMNLFGVMEVSGSALQAERIRAEVVAANMANAETTRTADGGPYQRQHVVFSSDAPQQSFASQFFGQAAVLNRIDAETSVAAFAFRQWWPIREPRCERYRPGPSGRGQRRLCGVSGYQSADGDGGPDGRNARLWAEQLGGAGGKGHGLRFAGHFEIGGSARCRHRLLLR